MKTLGCWLVCAALVGCGGDDGGNARPDAAVDAAVAMTQMIGPDGGTVTVPDGPTVTIPAGALTTIETIVITKLASAPLGAVTGEYRFEPEGLTFAIPATVSFPVTNAQTALDVYWSKAGGVAGYDELASTQTLTAVSAPITHFSTGYVAPVTPPSAVGTDHTYVLDSMVLPATNTESRTYGLDLDGDGAVDNQLGMVFATFAGMGIDFGAATTQAVDHGTVLVLANLVTTAFSTAQDAGFRTYLGATPSPAPCLNSGDTICRRHLAGTGTFTVATTSPTDAPLVGAFVNGTLSAGTGHTALQIALHPSRAFTLHLIGARTKLSGASTTAITAGVLAGGLNKNEVDTVFIPEFAAACNLWIADECNALTSPPGCGCTQSSMGNTCVGLLDTDHNCSISPTEAANNSLIISLTAPDIVVEGQQALSLGVGFTAVAGTFTP